MAVQDASPPAMSNKPIFVATHPRACSTAFERVFMTQRDTLRTVHEPFGDAFYYGPERMSARFEDDEKARLASGFSNSTYKTIFDRIDDDGADGKRVFIKDIIHYLFPPDSSSCQIAPSLASKKRGIGTEGNGVINGESGKAPYPFDSEAEPGNPTVVPLELLKKFHFAILIRNPHSSIPSYFRCTIPPLSELTGFHYFDPSEAGYEELIRFFHYLRSSDQIGPEKAQLTNGATNGTASGRTSPNGNGTSNAPEILVIDADDLLDDPETVVEAFCNSIGYEYSPAMLNWDNEADQAHAREQFAKWPGFHEDAINSKELSPRQHHKKEKSEAEWDAEWKEKYGDKAATMIRETVDQSMPAYLYLKQFAVKIR